MRKECASKDLPAFISSAAPFSVSAQRKEFHFFVIVLKKKKWSIKLLTEVSKTKTRKYNVLNSAGPNHLSSYDSS